VTTVLPDTGTLPAPAGPVPSGRFRRPFRRWGRSADRDRPRQLLPYLLLLPATVVLVVVLGYPLVRLLVLSTQEFGLRQQFGAPAENVGLENFRDILGDPYFWDVLRRTLVFCVVNVTATLVLGTLVALLLAGVGRRLRTALSVSLLLAWAMPALTATVVWQWLFDTQYGLVNRVLSELGADYQGHGWLEQPLSFFFVASIIVVWMGVPFVAFTLHAGLTQIPDETLEAAAIDGAGPWQRFRDVILPTLAPIYLVLAALSTLWDLKVFTQIYVLQQAGGITRDTNLLGVWAYRVSIGENRFDVGAAVAIVTVVITLLLTAVFVRRMLRTGDL
jgi:N,N'-diacetylchitobiose transport system permease protein